jgi:hypothetical protein
MPHKQGYSQKTISHNVRHMMATGRYTQKQAVAASLSTARRAAKKAGVRPSHLRKKR